ncbi:hypothetical protein GGI42DRAFT_329249 [Trichoderma sp. SZMC 28013]
MHMALALAWTMYCSFDFHWTICRVNNDSVSLCIIQFFVHLFAQLTMRKHRQSACSFLLLQSAMLASGIRLGRRWNDATSTNHQTMTHLS